MTSDKELDTSKKIFQTDCPICLETLCYPAKLPCEHVFCYLCIKGFLNTQNSRCALCRTEVPSNYLLNPNLMLDENRFESYKCEKSQAVGTSEDSTKKQDPNTEFVWYYEVNMLFNLNCRRIN